MTDETEPIKSIVTPVRSEYTYRVSGPAARFLEEIANGRLMGMRCPSCSKVYVPSRGACARCGVMTREAFANQMREGLNEAFEKFYESYDPKWVAVRIEANQVLGKLRMQGITHDEMYRA